MTYRISSGQVQDQNYGIILARAVGFPTTFIASAEKLSESLKNRQRIVAESSEARKVVVKRKLVLQLHEMLKHAQESDMEEVALSRYLARLQIEFVMRMEEIDGNDE
jgi:DNA mismatch repair protein MSH4